MDVTIGSEQAEQVATPSIKGDKKREAPSPLDAQEDIQKKTRHGSGVSWNESHQAPIASHAGDENSDIHFLSYPLNPADIPQIASELRALMAADLRSAVVGAVKEATGILKDEIIALRTQNSQLQKACSELQDRVERLEEDNDSPEQYSRRNSLRISNIPESPNEQTDKIVCELAEKMNVHIERSDIDRSHRVGRIEPRLGPGNRHHRDIIVKFARNNVRDQVFQVRKELRNTTQLKSIFINEDLTKKRSKLLFGARTLRRANVIKAAYSSGGNIFIRDNSDIRHSIKSDNDLSRFGNVEAAKKQLHQLRTPQID